MKKFGFTLTEVLLSMTIIGIVAAITAPTLINLMPNNEKVQTLKYQKLISEINTELLNNRTLYRKPQFDLDNTAQYLSEIYEYSTDVIGPDKAEALNKNKYAYLLMEKLEGFEDFTDNENTKYDEDEVIFKTADGYVWTVNSENNTPKSVIIDIDANNTTNAYGSQDNKYPTRFKFNIKPTGEVVCDENDDPITCRYLNCPYYVNNRNHDYKCIENYEGDCACNK